MHCWLSLVVSLDDGSLVELWLRSLSATFVAGRKMTCYSIFSILIATKWSHIPASSRRRERDKGNT